VGGYLCDITRTLAVGSVDPSWQPIAAAVLAANRAGVAAVVPGLIAANWAVFHPGTIIVGGIMVLVPGMAMTSAIRDGLAGDVVSAVSRMLEALLTAVAVAAGVALPLNLYLAMGGRWP
jgi:uncharacterized membrane protein YjjP (DUF1212 family)